MVRRVKKALILRWKLLNPPQNLPKILPMITGALHRLNTPPFSLSGRLSHFRAFSQIFDTGFSRLSPFSPFPSHHFPPALYARSIIPISRFSLVSRTQEFPNPHLDLETPVEEAVQSSLSHKCLLSESRRIDCLLLVLFSRRLRPKYILHRLWSDVRWDVNGVLCK